MNTKEFLAATSIPHASSLTYYIEEGIIHPEKVKGRNQFTQKDMENVVAFRSSEHKQKAKRSAVNPDLEYNLTSTYTTQEFMGVAGIKHQSIITRMVRKGILRPTRLNGRLHFNQQDVERFAAYKEEPYRDQTISKFEKLVQRVEQLEQEVLALKGSK